MRFALEFLVNFLQGIMYVLGAALVLASPIVFQPEFKRHVSSFFRGAFAATLAGTVIYLAAAILAIHLKESVGLQDKGWSFAVVSPMRFALTWLLVASVGYRAMAGAYRRAARLPKLTLGLEILGASVALAFSLVWAGALIWPMFY